MLSKIKNLFNLKIFTPQELEEMQRKIVDDALSAHRKAHQDFFSDDYINSIPVDNGKRAAFQSIINSIHSESVKDIINSSFSYFPDEEITQEELFLLQSAAREKFITDPLWIGVVGTLVDYVIGRGTSVSTPVKEINEVLYKFRKVNDFGEREKHFIQSLFIDGEYFSLIFNNPSTGDCYVRKADTKTIRSIETSEFDIEAVLSFKQEFTGYNEESYTTPRTSRIKNIDYDKFKAFGIYGPNPSKYEDQFLPNAVCKHTKLNGFDTIRGLPPARGILKYLKLYENFALDRLTLNHERSKVVWIKKITGRSSENDKSTTSPRGGTMLVETENISYRTERPNLDASEAKEDALLLLYYIGSAIRFPLHVLNQRTDQQVYASIRKSDTPFSTMIQGFQYLTASEFEPIYRYAILQKRNRKEGLKDSYKYPTYSEDALVFALQETVKMDLEGIPAAEIWNVAKSILKEGVEEVTKNLEEIPISQDFPQILQEDPLQQAQTLKIYKEMGIASLSTLATKAGLNWDKESSKIMLEAKSGLSQVSIELKPKDNQDKTGETKNV